MVEGATRARFINPLSFSLPALDSGGSFICRRKKGFFVHPGKGKSDLGQRDGIIKDVSCCRTGKLFVTQIQTKVYYKHRESFKCL